MSDHGCVVSVIGCEALGMSAKRKLIIVGGKGNGTLIASTAEDIIADGGDWEILGFLDDKYDPGGQLKFLGYPVLGKVADAIRFDRPDCFFCYGLFSAKNSIRMATKLRALGIPDDRFATLVHPTARVASGAKLGRGVCIMAFSFVGPEAHLGNHIIVHGQCYVARNSELEDYAYLAPRAYLGAEAVMKMGAYLGISVTVIERVTVGAWSVVGAGANVLKDVPEYSIAIGNPARVNGTVPDRWEEDEEQATSG